MSDVTVGRWRIVENRRMGKPFAVGINTTQFQSGRRWRRFRTADEARAYRLGLADAVNSGLELP